MTHNDASAIPRFEFSSRTFNSKLKAKLTLELSETESWCLHVILNHECSQFNNITSDDQFKVYQSIIENTKNQVQNIIEYVLLICGEIKDDDNNNEDSKINKYDSDEEVNDEYIIGNNYYPHILIGNNNNNHNNNEENILV